MQYIVTCRPHSSAELSSILRSVQFRGKQQSCIHYILLRVRLGAHDAVAIRLGTRYRRPFLS